MPKPFDLQSLIERVQRTLEAHRAAPTGVYRRFEKKGETLNPYGVADAANILCTLGQFPRERGERAAWIALLQSLQKPEDGLFYEATHHPFHVTAHCIAALELFDATPLHPLKGMAHLDSPATLREFLEKLDWRNDPWNASHQGAGVYAARVLAGEASIEWQNAYFEWLWQEADPQTGLWRRGCISDAPQAGVFAHLAGTFHEKRSGCPAACGGEE